MDVIIHFSLIFLALYVILSLFLLYGWVKPKHKPEESSYYNQFSIILPIRNEQKNIFSWLESINDLKYPEGNLEIIIVNDHSSDDSLKLIENNKKQLKFCLTVLNLPSEKTGKKEALSFGIERSRFNYIITTDADCLYNQNWVKSLNDLTTKEKPDMIIAPVKMAYNKSLFSKFQALEFSSLIGSGLSFANLNNPILSNGANLCFRKDTFSRVNGYQMKNMPASGDDIFLLEKFCSTGNLHIVPCFDPLSMVTTNNCISIKDFVNQRLRWASKGKYSSSILYRCVGAIVLGTNFSILIHLILTILNQEIFIFFILQIGIKFVFDFLFLFLVSSFHSEKKLMFSYPIVTIIYPFYISVIGLLSFKRKFEWKERIINGQ